MELVKKHPACAEAESFVRTLKIEAVVLADHETFVDMGRLPRFVDEVCNARRLPSAPEFGSPK
jgi:putative transposase